MPSPCLGPRSFCFQRSAVLLAVSLSLVGLWSSFFPKVLTQQNLLGPSSERAKRDRCRWPVAPSEITWDHGNIQTPGSEANTRQLEIVLRGQRWGTELAACKSENRLLHFPTSSLLTRLGKEQRMGQVLGPLHPRGRPGWSS